VIECLRAMDGNEAAGFFSIHCFIFFGFSKMGTENLH